ncbi:MAG: class I SAM-dependent methyltransferase [Anaerolineae bacterium]|nr:class I SAM-dependent methyltransferase [Anaerolineae bacterium]
MTNWEALYQQDESVWGEKPDDLLREYAPLVAMGQVLDLGMGEGRNALYFARHGYAVRGVDIAQTAIDHCLARAKALNVTMQAEIGNIVEIGIEPNSLTLAISTMCLQFMKQSESAKVMATMREGLQPGGLVYLTMFSTGEPAYARLKQSSPEIEPNTFYREASNSYVHFFEQDEVLNQFPDFKLLYCSKAIKLDTGHPGALEPHYHGIITYVGQKLLVS